MRTTRSALFSLQRPYDSRWVRCHRPFIVTGGELTLEMLELSYNSVTKIYDAPCHLKANNGMYLIDDFGRQRVLAGRVAQSLDRSHGKPRGSSDASHRRQALGALRSVSHLLHQPESRSTRRRGVSAPHPIQDAGAESQPRGVRRDLHQVLRGEEARMPPSWSTVSSNGITPGPAIPSAAAIRAT